MPFRHLSLEALTQLTNVGLVKRAQRELASGPPPLLTLGADGGVSAQFSDGVNTEFAPGAGVVDARCSCGAALCRHRLIVVLAWQAQQGVDAAAAQISSPGALDDARLKLWAGPTAWSQAERLRALGLLIDVRRPGADDLVPTAQLPQATVRFHGGEDPAAAQSDAAPTDHKACVVLGVWAFREADARDPQARTLQVQLGTRAVAAAALTQALQALAAGWLRHGLAAGHARHALALSAALDAARQLGATWVLLALLELEQWFEGYTLRRASFSASDGLHLLAELLGRARAGSGAGELAPQHALGVGERLETPLARVRLRALGLRIRGDGEARSAQLALFDPDTHTRTALVCRWDNAGVTGAATVERARAARVGGSVRLESLATGQLVSINAHRRADGELRLGAGHGGRTSTMAQSADWTGLPPSVRIDSVDAWRQGQVHLPPALLRPRQALSGHGVFMPAEISELGFDPASETLYAALSDVDGSSVLLTRHYEALAPGALDALARALSASTMPICIAGVFSGHGPVLELDPWALSDGQQLIIPDLCLPDGAVRDVPLGTLPQTRDPLQATLAQLADWLCLRLLGGPGAAGWGPARIELTRSLQRVGLSDLAQATEGLANCLGDLQTAADDAQLCESLTELLLALILTQSLASENR
jgi:hypothetical protein